MFRMGWGFQKYSQNAIFLTPPPPRSPCPHRGGLGQELNCSAPMLCVPQQTLRLCIEIGALADEFIIMYCRAERLRNTSQISVSLHMPQHCGRRASQSCKLQWPTSAKARGNVYGMDCTVLLGLTHTKLSDCYSTLPFGVLIGKEVSKGFIMVHAASRQHIAKGTGQVLMRPIFCSVLPLWEGGRHLLFELAKLQSGPRDLTVELVLEALLENIPQMCLTVCLHCLVARWLHGRGGGAYV